MVLHIALDTDHMHKNRLQTIHLLRLASLSSLLLLHLFHKRKYHYIKTKSFSHIHDTLHFKVNHVIWVERQLLPLAGSTKLCLLPVPVRLLPKSRGLKKKRNKNNIWHYIKSNSPLLVLRQVALYTSWMQRRNEFSHSLPSSRREKSNSGLHIQ